MNNARVRIASLLVAAPIVLAASGAFAQDAQPPAPTGTPGAPPAVAPATTAPAAPATTTEHKDDEYEGRLRIGFNINGGYGTAGNLSGPTFGGTFRVGWQIDALMGAYYQISPMVWAGSVSGASNLSISAIAGVQNSFMFSLTPADIIEVAAGPSADYLGGGSSSVGGVTAASAFGGVYLGIHGRVALHLGGRNPQTQRRRGFTLGGDIHPSFTPGDVSTFFTLGLGGDWY